MASFVGNDALNKAYLGQNIVDRIYQGSNLLYQRVSSQPEFLSDTNTYWWDFDFAGNIIELTGDDTVSQVVERLRGERNLIQLIKDYQPLRITDGITFNQTSNRKLSLNNTSGITNGKNGWYIAGVFSAITSNIYIMEISRSSTSTPSRGQLYLNGSRRITLKGNSTDSGTIPVVNYMSSQLTFNQTYAYEVLWDFVTNTFTIWIDGVQQALQFVNTNGGPWNSFPATDPLHMTFGNAFNATTSFNGLQKQIIFYDGVPSTEIRESISAYNLSRKT